MTLDLFAGIPVRDCQVNADRITASGAITAKAHPSPFRATRTPDLHGRALAQRHVGWHPLGGYARRFGLQAWPGWRPA